MLRTSIHSDSESGEISSSSDESSNDFSDKSSSEHASGMLSYEESLNGSSSRRKRVFRKKRTANVGGNKPEDGPRGKKKTTSNKYITVEDERIEETLKTCIKSVHTHRQFSRWPHLTTTTTIQFVFLFIFKFCIPSGVKITIALINMTQAKPEGFWYL